MFGPSKKTIRLEIQFLEGDGIESDDFEYSEQLEKDYLSFASRIGSPELYNFKIRVDGNTVFIPARVIRAVSVVVEE